MINQESIRIHPIFKRAMTYSDHHASNLNNLGDALGRDCIVVSVNPNELKGNWFLKSYINDGSKNEDWYTFGAEVTSPINGIVKDIHINETINNPGSFLPSRTTGIVIVKDDGTHVVLGHIGSLQVNVGDTVVEGQVIAFASNNGCSRNPHVHIGAWRDGKPLSIEFDLYKMSALEEKVSEIYYLTGHTEEEIKEINKTS